MNQRQHGFNLIEVMVTMTVGLIITASALQLMIGGNQSDRANEHSSMALENGRESMRILSGKLRKAGYRDIANGGITRAFYQGRCEGDAICTSEGGGSDSDRLAIQYEPMPDILGNRLDCTGVNV
ncbi:MAG: PilW family protein, partial [Endozoicomonas sp.]